MRFDSITAPTHTYPMSVRAASSLVVELLVSQNIYICRWCCRRRPLHVMCGEDNFNAATNFGRVW